MDMIQVGPVEKVSGVRTTREIKSRFASHVVAI
jgi:hypothetical protein